MARTQLCVSRRRAKLVSQGPRQMFRRVGVSCWSIMWKPRVIRLCVFWDREPVETRRVGPGSRRR